MPETRLSVQLLTMTPDAEALIYAAAKQCTSQDDASNIYTQAVVDKKNNGVPFVRQKAFICRVINSGHLSVLEHASFSFAISGVSRALSHQLVRHRIASYSQQSQRYVKADDFEYVVPPSVQKENFGWDHPWEASEAFYDIMRRVGDAYKDLLALGIPAEDARFVLPNACATKIVVTINARSLLHFFEQRCCMRAQWEIRAMADEMLRLCKEAVPVIFETAGAACVRKGFCEEEKCCGRAPRLKDVMKRTGWEDA